MKRTPRLFKACAILLAGVAMLLGCKDEELPTNPPPPFLFTSLTLSKDTRPTPETPLKPLEQVGLRYQLSYTLDQADAGQPQGLSVRVDLYAVTASDSIIEIGAFLDREYLNLKQADVIQDSIRFTVPRNAVRVNLWAYMYSASGGSFLDRFQGWPVR